MTDIDLAERVMLSLRLVSAAEQRYADAVASRAGLTSADLEALCFIIHRGSPTAGVIGHQMGLTSGAVTGLVDRLSLRGLVERKADPADRRKVKVVGTAIVPIAELFVPMQRAMTEFLTRHSDEGILLVAHFLEEAATLVNTHSEELVSGGRYRVR